MKIAVWFIAAICCYLIGGINLAIVLSKAIYHEDIREAGSGNPGFTNFKRTYGNKYAWFIFAFDILKASLPCFLFGLLFAKVDYDRQLGVAFSCFFLLLGHMFPIQYLFRGGKGFLVCFGALFFLDWRAGLIAAAVLAGILLTVKYMSLASMCSVTSGAVSLLVFGADTAAAVIYAVCVAIVVIRHAENIRRLSSGTEKKFYFRRKNDKQTGNRNIK